ncbi:MAG: ABC transporter permease [Veillonellales bacterium]
MGWYAVYSREMLLLRKKIGKMGYIFSTVISPFVYLLSFGMGLGGRVVDVGGGYLPFLATGIVGMTVIMNAFSQTATSLSGGRLYYHTFQSLILSPVRAVEVVFGMVLAGVARGIIFGGLVLAVARFVFGVGGLNLIGAAGILLGSSCFASFGLVVGMMVKQPDDVSMINNLFITPMVFFGGSFFPLQNLPPWLAVAAGILPIGRLNTLLRSGEWNSDVLWAAGILLLLTICFCCWGVWLYNHYSE